MPILAEMNKRLSQGEGMKIEKELRSREIKEYC